MNIDNKRDIPKVSYSTALDYFVGACFTFVLATIIQFAGVHFFTKHGSGEIQHDSDSEEEGEEDDHIVKVYEVTIAGLNLHLQDLQPHECHFSLFLFF